ncbi:MAG: N-formylglutamate amidohydrolase [Candidatus Cloacimonetes bacterium]|nr:N-formylglutamate amidohydrolase [Candidatus Cloacimonadota bacterium]
MLTSSVNIGDASLPLLATAIHNGHQMPAEMLEICGIDAAGRQREEDPFTGEMAALFPNHMVVESSRFLVDLNRAPEKAVYLKPEDCWGLPVRTETVPQPLLDRLREDHASWYRLLRYQIDCLLQLHPRLVVLDLHSYNHRRGGPNAEPDPQISNPDIIIGRSNLGHARYQETEALCRLLDGQIHRGSPLDCRQDVKFTGGHMSRWLNSTYPDRLICLAIEFKKTFMDEWSGELDRLAWAELKRLFFCQVRAWLSSQYGIHLPPLSAQNMTGA